ncbi:MAG TPA: glycosyltransferase family 4 protein [Blastocatellia bacterium]|nr:glycosyltransferase family 4 protein [Blastocatellia bacterium]
MKVSIIGPAYPLRGGIAHHVYWLSQQLAARGHQTQVISFRKLYPSILFPGTTEIDASRLKLDAGAKAILTPLNPATWLGAIEEVKTFAPDIVVFEWWQPFFGLITGTLARSFQRAGLKCVIECHNIVPHEGFPVDRWLSKFAFSPVDYFITHSKKDEQELQTIAPGKKTFVSPLPTLEEFSGSSTRARDGRTILFFGKVRKYKGLGVLLRAMPRVLERIECELLIVGEFYEPVEKYQKMIRELGIERSVRIENRYVPNEEVPGVFDRADVLVLPYVNASQSGVARIALSNALPIIASRSGGLSEVVIEDFNGLLFPTEDSGALADKILSYFTNGLGPVFANNLRASAVDNSNCRIIGFIESIMLGSLSGNHISIHS